MAANQQQQVAALLQSLLSRGIEAKDAIPTVKSLVQAKIFSLENVTLSNLPPSIDSKIRKKLLPRTKKSSSPKKKRRKTEIAVPPVTSTPASVLINRSPVLTLWATLVAQRLFDLELHEAVTVGNAVAASLAKAKGTSLGIYSKEETSAAEKKENDADTDLTELEIMGMTVTTVRTAEGIRALDPNTKEKQEPLDPHKTWSLLQRRFGDSFGFCFTKMNEAAQAPTSGQELDASAYRYYMHIRPDIAQGTKGWGAHGHLYTSKLSDFYPTNDTKKAAAKEEKE